MHSASQAFDVTVVLINYRTPELTLRCIRSLLSSPSPPGCVLVLDNDPLDAALSERLEALPSSSGTSIVSLVSRENLGFAGGCNLAIGHALSDPRCRYLLLLNNDAVAEPVLIPALKQALDASSGAGMAGGRMHALDAPDRVDTLGIAVHSSLMPANRLQVSDPFFGPTGGCCLMTRDFVREVEATFGYLFDARFFCYCEDTDLAFRANLLGYRPCYVDACVALHQGQASSGKGYNLFIAYHGLRNLIWMHLKLLPARLLVRHGFWLLLAHLLLVLRHLLAGHPGVVLRAYRDAWARLPEMLAERRTLGSLIERGAPLIERSLSRSFYQAGYARLVLRQLAGLYARLLGRLPGEREG